jgi:HSP20 family protein
LQFSLIVYSSGREVSKMTTKRLLPRRKNSKKVSRKGGEYPFLNISRNIDHLFKDFYHGIGLDPFSTLGMATAFIPKIDVYESSKEIKVIAELPGLDENDIDVSLTNDMLIISGEKKDKEEEMAICYKAERLYGWFTRAIPIPVEVDIDKVNAKFKNGILRILLQKIPESDSRRKKIHVIAD